MPDLTVNASTVGALLVLLVSISLHESAHAFVAHALGDPTPGERGRVTLNPFKHLDPFLSVLAPALLIFAQSSFLIGAGRPVPVRPECMRSPARDFALVALAGPASNVLLALLFTAAYVLLQRGDAPLVEDGTVVSRLLGWGIKINLFLAFFNLVPLPPLDGSRLVAYFLPRQIRGAFYRLDGIGIFILIALLLSGAFRWIMQPAGQAWRWWSDLFINWTFG
ncbi:MAG: site-2 protease family protein [Planctomycetes bacterium]|nr:site-2 protease family protein [Planctomycetota bacterium]